MAKQGYKGSPVERFWRRVDRLGPDECWTWTGASNGDGYGTFFHESKHIGAHCFSFEMHTGINPKGLHVCHKCDNPSCVNPAHLWLGTALDNMRDKSAKGRHRSAQREKTHCSRGHEFSEANTYRYKTMRVCRICQMIHVNKYRQNARHKRDSALRNGEARCASLNAANL